MTGEPQHFRSDGQALLTGFIVGLLLNGLPPDVLTEPLLDSDGNYTNEIEVKADGRTYRVRVTDVTDGEADPIFQAAIEVIRELIAQDRVSTEAMAVLEDAVRDAGLAEC